MNPTTQKILMTGLTFVSAGLAATFPQYAAVFASLASLLVGWAHLPRPGDINAKAP